LAEWGSQGSGDGQFQNPSGIAVDSLGGAYVIDSSAYRVQKFDSSGTFVMKWGSQGFGNGQFTWLTGIAADASGNIYVADLDASRIQKFTSSGAFLTSWHVSQPAGSVATGPMGDVYAASGPYKIARFATNGTRIGTWGLPGTSDGRFYLPEDVATGAA